MSSNTLLATLKKAMRNPRQIPGGIKRIMVRNRLVSDQVAIDVLFTTLVGYHPNLNAPRTFNEKLQWLKLHDRNPLYTKLVDKVEVKPWVAERIGWEHVVPTLGVWDSFDQIDFDALPERFVLKCTHDSGGLAICRDRATFDMAAARRKIERSLSRNFYWVGREWPYKDVRPRVLAEEYLEPDTSNDLPDYKLFRFSNGRIVTLLMTDRFTEAGLTQTFFDEEWRPLDIAEGGYTRRPDAPAPEGFEKMKELAGRLAEGLPFARVDFYESTGRLYFGEMTLYPKSGFEQFDPKEWDTVLGSWIELPSGGWLLVSSTSLLWLHESASTTSPSVDLTDYKFMCFGGRARCAFTCTGRAEGDLRVDFFDAGWNHLPFTRHYPNADVPPERPRHLEEMIALAERLSEGIPFVRVDFYEQGDRVLFGEMTFYPGSGFEEFAPEEWDERLGSWLNLPEACS